MRHSRQSRDFLSNLRAQKTERHRNGARSDPITKIRTSSVTISEESGTVLCVFFIRNAYLRALQRYSVLEDCDLLTGVLLIPREGAVGGRNYEIKEPVGHVRAVEHGGCIEVDP